MKNEETNNTVVCVNNKETELIKFAKAVAVTFIAAAGLVGITRCICQTVVICSEYKVMGVISGNTAYLYKGLVDNVSPELLEKMIKEA